MIEEALRLASSDAGSLNLKAKIEQAIAKEEEQRRQRELQQQREKEQREQHLKDLEQAIQAHLADVDFYKRNILQSLKKASYFRGKRSFAKFIGMKEWALEGHWRKLVSWGMIVEENQQAFVHPLISVYLEQGWPAVSGSSGKTKEPKVPEIAMQAFDVFLCHNGQDKSAVKQIGEQLKLQGILPWLDEWELRPGLPWQPQLEQQIKQCKSAAVFVGRNGIGPWQQQELEALLRVFVQRGRLVIPILLQDAPEKPELPIFLEGMTWVDFRVQNPDPMQRLIWGITGRREVGKVM